MSKAELDALQRKYDHLLEIAEEWGSYLADPHPVIIKRLDVTGKEWIERLKMHPRFENLIKKGFGIKNLHPDLYEHGDGKEGLELHWGTRCMECLRNECSDDCDEEGLEDSDEDF